MKPSSLPEIWVRNYINPVNDYQLDPLFFTVIGGKEFLVKHNNGWKNSSNMAVLEYPELVGKAQDRKLKIHEIIALRLQGIIEL
jgi:hypothetical protein